MLILNSPYYMVFICPNFFVFRETVLYGFYLSFLCLFSWVLTICFLSVLPCLIFMNPYDIFSSVLRLLIFASPYYMVFICPSYVEFHESLLYAFYLSYLCWFSWVLTTWLLSVLPMLILMSPYYMVFICPSYIDFHKFLLYGFFLSYLCWFSWVLTI